MPVNSLTNMTVPLGSEGQSSSTQGLLMPKLKYRFRVLFLNFGVTQPSTELTKQVMDFTRPEVEFELKTIDIYNSKVKYAGKPTWGNATLNVRDDMQGNVSRLVGEQIQKQFDFAQQASGSSGIDYKMTVSVDILDGGNGAVDPIVLENWTLVGSFITQVNYGELSYESSDPATIQMILSFDNAFQTPNGVGTTSIPRTLGTIAI